MKKNILTFVVTTTLLVFLASCNGRPKTDHDAALTEKNSESRTIQVIQFHSENRCMTCNKIEALTLESLKSYPELQFKLVNVDQTKNEQVAEQFEATGTALFLYNPSTKEKLDLTEFAFMSAGDEAKFETELKKEIEKFIN